jgi:rod shape-determining protein MreC
LNFFAFDLRKAAIIAFIVALPLLSINMQRNPGEEPWYKKPITFAASLAQSGYSSFASGVRGTVSQYFKLVGIKKDIQALQRENEELRAKLGALGELSLENQRLNKLLDFKQRTNMEIVAAKIIARELTPDNVSLRINRGLKHGLKKLQAVITVEGVVGYVYRPDVLTSQVLVLTDRSSAIDAIVQRTRASGLVSGKSRNVARLRYLERAGDVAVGDMIVTSGLQGYFPKGFPIGKITAVKKTEYGISQEAQVAPIVNPANVEEVFVVLNSGNEDFSERYGDPDFGPPFLSKMNPVAKESKDAKEGAEAKEKLADKAADHFADAPASGKPRQKPAPPAAAGSSSAPSEDGASAARREGARRGLPPGGRLEARQRDARARGRSAPGARQ